jgi:hypothetical protein
MGAGTGGTAGTDELTAILLLQVLTVNEPRRL